MHGLMCFALLYASDALYASNLKRLFRPLNIEDRYPSGAMFNVS